MLDCHVAFSSIAATILIALANPPTASFAQSAQAPSCINAYDACRDECIHLGVIKVGCFKQCKRRWFFCSTKEALSPARLNPFRRDQAAPSQSPVGAVQ
jgi:hypothetical protein